MWGTVSSWYQVAVIHPHPRSPAEADEIKVKKNNFFFEMINYTYSLITTLTCFSVRYNMSYF